jgi:hypothetical protein
MHAHWQQIIDAIAAKQRHKENMDIYLTPKSPLIYQMRTKIG